jgi:hypothetical protein
MKDSIPIDDPRRAEEIKKRIAYLQSLTHSEQKSIGGDAATSAARQTADAEAELTSVYSSLRSRLNAQQKASLKADEIRWIKTKDSIPVEDSRRAQAISNKFWRSTAVRR